MSSANVIFDLDGTLVDSLSGIEQSARAAITAVLPDEPMPDLRSVIGPPIGEMFAMLWPKLAWEKMHCLVAAFRSHYFAKGCLAVTVFPGVPETLARLHASGLRLFVLTNKPSAPTKKILEHLALANLFDDTLSPDSFEPPFRSKPEGARLLTEKLGLNPEKTTLVGDGADDAISAEVCGFRFIAAAYGYGTAAARSAKRLEKFSEIEQLLL